MVMVRSDKKHICLGCLGVFVVLCLIGSVMNVVSPPNETSSIQSTAQSDTAPVEDSVKRVNVSTDDNETYWYFTGQTSPSYDDGYDYVLHVNGSDYYMSDALATSFREYSRGVAVAYMADASFSEPTEKIRYGFKFENDVNFTFEYESGQKVGINENQNVIKKIYVNGTSI